MSDQVFTSVDEFAALTSLSARSVWRLLARGRLPSVQVGRRRLIPVEEAAAALRALDRGRDAQSQAREADHA